MGRQQFVLSSCVSSRNHIDHFYIYIADLSPNAVGSVPASCPAVRPESCPPLAFKKSPLAPKCLIEKCPDKTNASLVTQPGAMMQEMLFFGVRPKG